MKRLIEFLTPYWKQLLLVITLLLVQTIANLYLPELNAKIINEGVAKGDTTYILQTGGTMLAVTFMLGVAAIVGVYWGSKAAMAFGRDVRGAVFRRVESFSQAEINIFGTPSLITRNTNDVQQVQMVVLMMLNVVVSAPIMAVGGVFMALRLDVPLSGLLVVIIPVMAILVGSVLYRAMPLFKEMQIRIDGINQVTREKLAGIRVIRAFVRTDFEERRFDTANHSLTDVSLSVNRLFAAMLPALMLIFNLSTVAIIWFGGQRVASGDMPIGDLTAFLAYIMQILTAVMMATIMFVMVPRAAASWTRIQAVLETEPAIFDPATPALRTGASGCLEFRDVEFRYPGAEDPVLCGVTFSAKPGEVTAIVGSTGSGKSTLINLIPRFFDATGGAVLIDGVDVREMAQHQVWDAIGFIPQKAFLFAGTVASNLRYGKDDATDEELWHALEVAQGKAFVSAMEGGLDAPITQGGSNLSGGQRQRLAIARALVKRPEIYVFDDSFSALDFATDAKLRAALVADTREATVLIVAQRVTTIMNADRIIVMDGGRIVGMGTHDELLASNETYREIVFSQLSEEEVA